MAQYLIPKERVRIVHTVSNSRFIATVDRASSVEEAKVILSEIRTEMPDASHHVHALRIGYGNSVTEGMSDDGEPSGTAGPPALAVVRGSDVGDVVLVITRYFGGTKLGTGGLVSAYGTAAKMAMAALKTEKKVDRVRFALEVPYGLHSPVRRNLEMFQGRIIQEDFGESVSLICDAPAENLVRLEAALKDLSGGTLKLTDPML